MLSNTQIPETKKAVNVIREMSEDEKVREMVRLREKTMRDEASRLEDARNEGIAEGMTKGIAQGIAQERANIIKRMGEAGIDEETIRTLLNMEID